MLVLGLLIYPKEFPALKRAMKFEDILEKEFHSMLYKFTLKKTEQIGKQFPTFGSLYHLFKRL